MRIIFSILIFIGIAVPLSHVAGQRPDGYAYADIADLAAEAPIVAQVTVRRAEKLSGDSAAAVPEGVQRLYLEGEVSRLIRGADAIPERVRFLADFPADVRRSRLKKQIFFIMARPAAGRLGDLQLVAPDALVPVSEANAALIESVVREAVNIDAAPAIAGISRAFHVPGTVEGESETQIFFQTRSGDPVSISVIRRPGQEPQWGVSLSEIVDSAASRPRRETLLWYRLACGSLPQRLPFSSTVDIAPADRDAAAVDYAYVLTQLGSCERRRVPVR